MTTHPFKGHRRLVVTLVPRPEGEQIHMRLERDRERNAYRAPLADVFRALAQWHADREKARKKKARLEKQRIHAGH